MKPSKLILFIALPLLVLCGMVGFLRYDQPTDMD